MKRLRFSIVLGYAVLMSSSKNKTTTHFCHFFSTSAAHAQFLVL